MCGRGWVWANTFPLDIYLVVATWIVGLILILAWLIYLFTWVYTVRRFRCQMLVIPLIGIVAIVVRFSGVAADARWEYDEPRLRAEAERVLAQPDPEFSDSQARKIGTQDVGGVYKSDGVVYFTIPGSLIGIEQLVYHPQGANPDGSDSRISRIDDRWWWLRD